MRKKIGNCLVTSNMKQREIWNGFDVPQSVRDWYIDETSTEGEIEDFNFDYFFPVNGNYYGFDDFCGGSFPEFEAYIQEHAETFGNDPIICYINHSYWLGGAVVFDSGLDCFIQFNFTWL